MFNIFCSSKNFIPSWRIVLKWFISEKYDLFRKKKEVWCNRQLHKCDVQSCSTCLKLYRGWVRGTAQTSGMYTVGQNNFIKINLSYFHLLSYFRVIIKNHSLHWNGFINSIILMLKNSPNNLWTTSSAKGSCCFSDWFVSFFNKQCLISNVSIRGNLSVNFNFVYLVLETAPQTIV